MRRESVQVELFVSPEVVYDFLIDYRNDVRWRPELKSVELRTGTSGEPGAVYDGTMDWQDVTFAHTLELVDCTRPVRIHVKSEAPNLCVDVVYRLHEHESGCLLVADYTLCMEGPQIVLEPFGWAMLMGWAKEDLPNLQSALEGQPGSS